MRIPRLWVPELPPRGEAALAREAAHHARRVLRLAPGDALHLFDGRGREVAAVLTEQGALVGERVTPLDAGAPRLLAACSPPRGERFEWLVEKATELGLAEMVPLVTTRTPPRSRRIRRARLEKSARQACEQCGRAQLPRIHDPQPLAGFLARPDLPSRRFLLDREGGPRPGGAGGEAAFLAGPEGGLTAEETAQVKAAGFQPVHLGPLVLRVETALLAALAGRG